MTDFVIDGWPAPDSDEPRPTTAHELKDHPGRLVAPMLYGRHRDPVEVRKWIEGFR